MGVLSPQTVGGTSTVLHLYTEDVETRWKRAVDAGALVLLAQHAVVEVRPLMVEAGTEM